MFSRSEFIIGTPVMPHGFDLFPFTNKKIVVVLIFGTSRKSNQSHAGKRSGYNPFHIQILLKTETNRNKKVSRLGFGNIQSVEEVFGIPIDSIHIKFQILAHIDESELISQREGESAPLCGSADPHAQIGTFEDPIRPKRIT